MVRVSHHYGTAARPANVPVGVKRPAHPVPPFPLRGDGVLPPQSAFGLPQSQRTKRVCDVCRDGHHLGARRSGRARPPVTRPAPLLVRPLADRVCRLRRTRG